MSRKEGAMDHKNQILQLTLKLTCLRQKLPNAICDQKPWVTFEKLPITGQDTLATQSQ